MFLLQVCLVPPQPLSVLSGARECSNSLQQKAEDDLELTNMEYFNRADLDGWEIRKGMAFLLAHLVPQAGAGV